MAKMFVSYSIEDLGLIKEYFMDKGYEVVIPHNFKEYVSGLLLPKKRKTIITTSRMLRAPAKILGIRRAGPQESLNSAKQYKALKEALLLLNKKGIPCYFYNRVGLNKNGFQYDTSACNRMAKGITFPKMCEKPSEYEEDFKQLLGEKYSSDYIKSLKKIPQIIYNGSKYAHEDMSSELVNTIGGIRITTNQPEHYSRTIHIYGRCGAFGYAVEDGENFPSFLQKALIAAGTVDIRVVNHGLWGGDDNCIIHNFLMDSGNYTSSDIVLFYERHFSSGIIEILKDHGMWYHDITEEWHKNEEAKWCFYDKPGHMNRDGYRNVAEIVCKSLLQHDFEKKGVSSTLSENLSAIHLNKYIKESVDNAFTKDLDKYLCGIIEKYPIDEKYKYGAIVMNCNPFTKGHQQLIEYASNCVDRLYIFVVEENRSFFSFDDRFEMVKRGTDRISNVIVVPSGKFIISALTFPEYFLKDYVTDKTFDVSMDLDIFCNHIAPRLNITIRFAGEEPFDSVTQNYNDNMGKILPQHGIEFKVIPRFKVSDEKVISATQVRKLMEDRNYDEIKEYVPETTYEVLKGKYFKI